VGFIRRHLRQPPQAIGVVDAWFGEEGWGVILSPEVDGKVFAHFSHIVGTGLRNLHPGEAVRFKYSPYGHDGCEWMATDISRT
jgi:CspA family cold shock protein